MASSGKAEDFPLIQESLVTNLEKIFSCGPPLKGESIEDLYRRAGHAEIISYLKQVQDRQNTGLSKESTTDVFLRTQDPRSSPSPSNASSRRRTRRGGSGPRSTPN